MTSFIRLFSQPQATTGARGTVHRNSCEKRGGRGMWRLGDGKGKGLMRGTGARRKEADPACESGRVLPVPYPLGLRELMTLPTLSVPGNLPIAEKGDAEIGRMIG